LSTCGLKHSGAAAGWSTPKIAMATTSRDSAQVVAMSTLRKLRTAANSRAAAELAARTAATIWFRSTSLTRR
jgi:hypothetical protein